MLTEKCAKTKGWIVRPDSCAIPKIKDGSKVYTMKLCQSEYAAKMIEPEDSRKILSVIPCTFAVYQKADGCTYVSRINVGLLGALMGGAPGKVFPEKVAPEQEGMLEGIAE